jgi:predicted esterase
LGTCADPRPAGAPKPPSPPGYSKGTCPALKPGANEIKTGSDTRKFLLVVPSDHDGEEPLPLIFLWHWLGGSAKSFLQKGEVQQATDQLRFAAIIPEAKEGTLNTFKWPYSIAALPNQVDDELRLFDDLLSCVSEQYPIQSDCVASMGVSAGALWTDQLAGFRGEYLSSIVSLSGGVGGPVIKPWKLPARKMPAYVLWGGPKDVCVTVQFEQTSKNLQKALSDGGHFQVECIHNCAHAEPPLDPIEGFSKYTPVWRFFLDHPYWLAPGVSPWKETGMPPGSPSWCSIGPGTATPRVGECPEPPSCPI